MVLAAVLTRTPLATAAVVEAAQQLADFRAQAPSLAPNLRCLMHVNASWIDNCAPVPDYVLPFQQAVRTAHAAGLLPTHSTVIDVGAAFGHETRVARCAGHPVFAFECRFDEYVRLKQDFSDDGRVIVLQACLTDAVGIVRLHRAKDSSSLSLYNARGHAAERAKWIRDGRREEPALALTIDAIFGGSRDRVGLIKIDVQGAEAAVLRGALRTITHDWPVLYYEDTFTPKELRGGKLLNTILNKSSSALYRCDCDDRDCTCLPQLSRASHRTAEAHNDPSPRVSALANDVRGTVTSRSLHAGLLR